MAARTLRPRHQDEVRQKIQTSQLINRLENYALSDSEDELSTGRLKAIEILLRKTLPDLSATQLSTDPENPLVTRIELVALDASTDKEIS